MREFLYFTASLAGAALLTALGIIYAPALGTWNIVAYVAAGVLSLCAIGLLADIIRHADRRKMIPLIGMVVFGGAFFVSAAWYFWPYPSKTESGAVAASNGFFAECQQQIGPIKIPTEGLYFIQVSETDGGGLGHLPVTDPSQIGQTYNISTDKTVEALQCRLYNYESLPALDVTLSFKASFRKVERRGIVGSPGDIVSERMFRVPISPLIGKIDTGGTNAVTLYIQNRSQENGLTLAFSNTIYARLLTEEKARPFQLRAGGTAPMLMPESRTPSLAAATATASPVASPKLSLQRAAIFYVSQGQDIFQLGMVIKLFNLDAVPYLIHGVTFSDITFNYTGRGSTVVSRAPFQIGDQAEVTEDNYIRAGDAASFKVLLPIKIGINSEHSKGAPPEIITFGKWLVVIGDKTIPVEVRNYGIYEHLLSRADWDGLLKPGSAIDLDALQYKRQPAKPILTGPYGNYLIYNQDPSAVFDVFGWDAVPTQRNPQGAMTFIRGRGEPPLDSGWIVLGRTYQQVWTDSKKLALYNSIFAPDANGRPRPFGVFMGAEAEMMGRP